MSKKIFRAVLICALGLLAVLNFGKIAAFAGDVMKALEPVLIGVFIAVIMDIPVRFLSKKVFGFKGKKPRLSFFVSLTVSYLTLFAVLGGIVWLLVPPLADSLRGLSEKLPDYAEQVRQRTDGFLTGIGLSQEQAASIKNKFTDFAENAIDRLGDNLPAFADRATRAFNFSLNVFFALILSVYMLCDKKRLLNQLHRFTVAVLPAKVSKWLIEKVTLFVKVFVAFISGQAIEALLLGVLTFIGMMILKLPYTPLVATVVAAVNLIPMLGAYIGGTFGFVLIGLVSFKQAVIFLIFMIALQQLENNITYPKVVGNSLGLSGFWIMAAVLVGGALFGFWGIMLGVPAVAAVYKILGRTIPDPPVPGQLVPFYGKDRKQEPR